MAAGFVFDEVIISNLRTVCGLADDDSFDNDLATYAGGAFSTMAQVGVGKEDFVLTTGEEKWSDLLGEEAMKTPIFPLARQYTQLYVRQLFDPPAPTTVTYMQSVLEENIWRLKTYADELLKEGGVINGKPSDA